MRQALFPILLFPFCLGLYLLFAGSLSTNEMIAGVPVALACTGTAMLFRLREERRLRLPVPPLRAILHVLAALPLDAGRVGATLLRALWAGPSGARGAISPQPFRAGGRQPEAAGRRALVMLGASLAPNGYVVQPPSMLRPPGDTEPMLLHRLAAAAPSRDLEWPV